MKGRSKTKIKMHEGLFAHSGFRRWQKGMMNTPTPSGDVNSTVEPSGSDEGLTAYLCQTRRLIEESGVEND